ncbi:hypothetical protein [Lacinutrix sp. MedPE-SW]|uniref:hypothetical protein n=1 Tax=Lacinutrix sp. MedPE-SW TaxID=1860087 RepID=UPI0009233E6A|nr:hypothetical protein [Lacinutrix sp. MedPE-SW]OIQ23531.1 MAG: hypothetical protein BM549_02905 [Lacinutrix sp. MedPE-SW]
MDNNRYLTISPSLYVFLKPFLNTHQTWDIKVSNDVYKFDRGKSEYLFKAGAKQKLHDYKILHISYPKRNFINFEKSVFFTDIKDNYLKNMNMEGISESYIENPTHKKIEITSDNDYRSLIEKMKHIKPKSVVIPRKIVCNLNYNKDEIFRLITPINNMSGYYVSAELKKKIEEIGFTGMEFKLLKNLNPSIKVEV